MISCSCFLYLATPSGKSWCFVWNIRHIFLVASSEIETNAAHIYKQKFPSWWGMNSMFPFQIASCYWLLNGFFILNQTHLTTRALLLLAVFSLYCTCTYCILYSTWEHNSKLLWQHDKWILCEELSDKTKQAQSKARSDCTRNLSTTLIHSDVKATLISTETVLLMNKSLL